MNPDEITRILASQETITPSSRFLASVMQAVEREAAAPPPLAFPWMRALPGLLAVLVAVIAGVMSWAGDPTATQTLEQQLGGFANSISELGLQWIALGGLVTVVSLGCALVFARDAKHFSGVVALEME